MLSEPYDTEKAKLIVREMTELLVLDLVRRGVVTKKVTLTVGYDRTSLTPAGAGRYLVAKTGRPYRGEVKSDPYGRPQPKLAHGTGNIDRWTSSAKRVTAVMMDLYDRIVDPDLLVRRVWVVACNLIPEDQIPAEGPVQLDLFTDYAAPDAGFALVENSLTYTPEGGTATPITADPETGVYTFQMPASSVTLSAAFARLHSVTIADDIQHGTVSAEKEQYYETETVTLRVEPAAGYLLDTLTVTDANGNLVTVENDVFTMPACDVQVNATFATIPFGTPDFTMPAALTTIEESAFEGDTEISIVDASNVTTIGKWAFKDCTGLTQIKLSQKCSIDDLAFSGCETVYVYAPAGGSTQEYCERATNPCIFVELKDTDETLNSFTEQEGPVYQFPSGSTLPSIIDLLSGGAG